MRLIDVEGIRRRMSREMSAKAGEALMETAPTTFEGRPDKGGAAVVADPIAKIKAERQKVYGDPRENHRGIAQMWACLLQPHADAIKRGDPMPEHVIALMMAALKLNRMRRVFHQDNYDDLTAYLSFAREWQEQHDKAKDN